MLCIQAILLMFYTAEVLEIFLSVSQLSVIFPRFLFRAPLRHYAFWVNDYLKGQFRGVQGIPIVADPFSVASLSCQTNQLRISRLHGHGSATGDQPGRWGTQRQRANKAPVSVWQFWDGTQHGVLEGTPGTQSAAPRHRPAVAGGTDGATETLRHFEEGV